MGNKVVVKWRRVKVDGEGGIELQDNNGDVTVGQ